MKFRDLPVGAWFNFRHTFSGAPSGPFKKTRARGYLYRHRLGWYEVNVGSVNVEVDQAQAPEDAPAEDARPKNFR